MLLHTDFVSDEMTLTFVKCHEDLVVISCEQQVHNKITLQILYVDKNAADEIIRALIFLPINSSSFVA